MKCWTRDCKNESIKNRHWCHACIKRKYRNKYPLKYAYDTIKFNAKRRGKEFLLTFKEFKDFCNESNYHNLRGISAENLSIDRKDNLKGYSVENIKAITISENSKKAR